MVSPLAENSILYEKVTGELMSENNRATPPQQVHDGTLLKFAHLAGIYANANNSRSADTREANTVQDAQSKRKVSTLGDFLAAGWTSSEDEPLLSSDEEGSNSENNDSINLNHPQTIMEHVDSGPLLKIAQLARTYGDADNGQDKLKVKQAIRLRKAPNIYKMSSRPRGYFVIINNYKFHCPKKYRHGSKADEKRLTSVFKQLNFEVKRFRNLKSKQMVHFLKKVSTDLKLQKHDALVVMILSHGTEAGIMGTDGKCVPLEEMILPFSNKNCPNLKNKPKVFFVQACRGNLGSFDYDVDDVPDAGGDDTSPTDVHRPPSALDDIFVCYASQEGYPAMRNKKRGSWLGEALAEVLTKCAWAWSFMDIIEELRDVVGRRRSKRGHTQSIDVYHNGLTNDFYFNPGLSEDGGL